MFRTSGTLDCPAAAAVVPAKTSTGDKLKSYGDSFHYECRG